MNAPLSFPYRLSRPRRPFVALFTIAALALGGVRPVMADDNWYGTDSGLWSDGNNWSSGNPNNNYGTLYFNDNNNGMTNLTDDLSSVVQNSIKFYDTSTWVVTSSNASNTITLYDNNGAQSEVDNYSTGSVTLGVSIIFNANNNPSGGPPNPYGNISAVNANLTFNAGTITVSGPTVYGIRMFGGATETTFYNSTVNASNGTNGGNGDKYFALIGQNNAGTNMTVGGTFNSGDVYVMNGSTLNLASTGSLTTTAIRLGGDYGATGDQNLALGGTFNLTAAAGGQTFSSIINTVGSNTSNALVVNSQNTSGTNTVSSSIYLDSNLAINQSGGGTLLLNGGTIDVKNDLLTYGGAGVINVTTGMSNSLSGGMVTYNGSGTLLLNGNNNYSGATNINSGTLGGNGTVAGSVNINAGATIHAGQVGAPSPSIIGTLTTGALTLASTSTSIFDLASNTNYDQFMSTGVVTLAGTLTINNIGTFTQGTTLDLVHGTSLTGTYNGIANDGVYTFGGQAFEAIYTGTDFDLVVVPEPATYLAGMLMLGMVGFSQRRRISGFFAARFA